MKLLLLSILFTLLFTSCERDEEIPIANDGVPPNPPIGLRKYLETDGEIGFEWPSDQQQGIKGYNVFKSVNDTINYDAISHSTNNFFEEFYLDYDSTYYYKVSAVDVFDLESEPSALISFNPVNRFRPGTPSQLFVSGKNWFDELWFDLRWYPPFDTDIKGYEIHRAALNDFVISDSTFIGISNSNNFRDSVGLEMLKTYFYKIVAVDKGGLKSRASFESSDLILDRPLLVFPQNNSSLNYFDSFEITTVSKPASYKLFIQTNELFGVIYEKEFSNSEISSNIRINVDGVTIEPFRKYYWRIAVFTKDFTEVNSFSDVYSFTIIQ